MNTALDIETEKGKHAFAPWQLLEALQMLTEPIENRIQAVQS